MIQWLPLLTYPACALASALVVGVAYRHDELEDAALLRRFIIVLVMGIGLVHTTMQRPSVQLRLHPELRLQADIEADPIYNTLADIVPEYAARFRAVLVIWRDHARQYSQERFAAPAQEIGRIWQSNFDIDIAGTLLDGSMLYGECKWWAEPVGENVLDELIERASRTEFGRGNDRRQFVLYARKGFTAALRKRAAAEGGIALHTPQSMLRSPGKRSSP